MACMELGQKAYFRKCLFEEVFQLVLYDSEQTSGFVSSFVPIDILMKFINIGYEFIDQLAIPFRLRVTLLQFAG